MRETVKVNLAKTVYAKTNRKNYEISDNEWFRAQFENKKARYVNGQKIKRWQDSSGVQFPFTPLLNASGNNVYTEADLVNARTQIQHSTRQPTRTRPSLPSTTFSTRPKNCTVAA